MPPKRPSPNKPKPPSSKKPRKPPADKKDPSRQDEEGPREEWGPVPEYLHYESPYPPGRNMHKIRELYATHAGERPYVAPWVHFGESVSHLPTYLPTYTYLIYPSTRALSSSPPPGPYPSKDIPSLRYP